MNADACAKTSTHPQPASAAASWVAIFGPGAIIASLTIGAGELIFSARAGALFGYHPLWFFLVVLALKWALVFGSARHIVLTGAHPLERWVELPGPRGWLIWTFALLAGSCFPIWVGFHAGTLGGLIAALTGTSTAAGGASHFIWGAALLVATLGLSLEGGYSALEKVQFAIVAVMLAGVTVSLVFLDPDWMAFLKSFFVPTPLVYPAWIDAHAEIAKRPVWLEAITYVGVLGGSGYDYLAYTAYLREKHWGRAGSPMVQAGELSATPRADARRWLKAPLIDCTLSFAVVLIFSAVFVACGAEVLAPQHKVPSGTNLLAVQADFINPSFPWLRNVYFAGALLAIFGTLYGTIEVAPAVYGEFIRALNSETPRSPSQRNRRVAVVWVGVGGLAVLVASMTTMWLRGTTTPPGLVALLTPANLFTGVLACGVICAANLWCDFRFLPRALRMGWPLASMNAIAAIVFVALGIKGYWDHSGWTAMVILLATLAAGCMAAGITQARRGRR